MTLTLKKRLINAVCVLCCLCAACREHPQNGPAHDASVANREALPTEDEVRQILTEGLSRERVVAVFGDPVMEDAIPDGTTMAIYSFPQGNSATSWENRFTGFQIYYKNNQLVRWSPIYSTQVVPSNPISPPPITRAEVAKNSFVAIEQLSFYVVSESNAADRTYVDTPKFPKVGYVAQSPELVFRHLKSVEAGKQFGQPTIIINFIEEDTRRVKKLTTENIGKQILILVDHLPILAPRVQTPIDTGRLEITGLSEKEFHNLYASLKTLVVEK